MGDAVGVVGVEQPLSGDDIVEQVVVADKGAEGMERRALLPAVLVQAEIEEILIGEDGKGIAAHDAHPLSQERTLPLRVPILGHDSITSDGICHRFFVFSISFCTAPSQLQPVSAAARPGEAPCRIPGEQSMFCTLFRTISDYTA